MDCPSDLQCSICFQIFDQPTRLPCDHAYCKACITNSLEINSQCPMCRRVFCIPIGEELQVDESLNGLVDQFKQNPDTQIPQPNYKKPTDVWWMDETTKVGIPVFQYHVQCRMGENLAFNFFEKRYVHMVTESLKKNLLLCIDSGSKIDDQKYGDIFQIVTATKEQMGDQLIYQCEVKKMDRCKMTNCWLQSMEPVEVNAQQQVILQHYPLLYTISEPIHDNYDNMEEDFPKTVVELAVLLEKLNNAPNPGIKYIVAALFNGFPELPHIKEAMEKFKEWQTAIEEATVNKADQIEEEQKNQDELNLPPIEFSKKDLEGLTLFSLKMLSSLNKDQENYSKLFYGDDLLFRLKAVRRLAKDISTKLQVLDDDDDS